MIYLDPLSKSTVGVLHENLNGNLACVVPTGQQNAGPQFFVPAALISAAVKQRSDRTNFVSSHWILLDTCPSENTTSAKALETIKSTILKVCFLHAFYSSHF
jgi:hypothetical protein